MRCFRYFYLHETINHPRARHQGVPGHRLPGDRHDTRADRVVDQRHNRQPRPGGIVQFRFGDVFRPDMKVLMSDGSGVRWECVSGEKDWAGSTFRFSMDETAGMIRLTFVQEYANFIPDEKYGRFNFNWGYYLYSLKKYCETGVGLPFK